MTMASLAESVGRVTSITSDLESLVTANELIQPIARVLQLLNNRFTATIISNTARSIYVRCYLITRARPFANRNGMRCHDA